MLDKELDGLPRGVVRSAQRSAAMSGPLRILASIPSHLEQLYDKPARPGLSKHMAGITSSLVKELFRSKEFAPFVLAGLLLCVSAPVELETSSALDGTNWRRLGRKFSRYVSNFVNEVCVHYSSEQDYCLLLSVL